jgi:hypothetical protein
MGRRYRDELESENLAIYRELEDMRDRLDSLLSEEDAELDEEAEDDRADEAGTELSDDTDPLDDEPDGE